MEQEEMMVLVRFLVCPGGGFQAINLKTGESLGFFNNRIEALLWLAKEKNHQEA